MNDILLSEPQFRLVTSDAKYPAFVGGFGSGKTAALINRGLKLKAEYPSNNIAYYLPTYDLVTMIAFPRFEEKLELMSSNGNHIPYKSVKSPRPSIKIEDCGEIIFRTMDNPARIVGYEVGDSLIDELDILKVDAAKATWQKIIARNRQKKPDGRKNTVAVGCTPEGYKFVYNKWQRDAFKEDGSRKKSYELIKASTYSNQKNLPSDYIKTLMEDYPSALIQAYIMGEFVNLTSGSVYGEFDRELNGCDTEIRPDDILHVGMDFNVTKMAAVVFVKRTYKLSNETWEEAHAVAELTKIFDTPAMIKALKNRFPNHRVAIYPDASGGSRKTVEASTSDIAMLNAAGFQCYNDRSNPAIKDRVLSMNVMINNNNQKRRLKVNVKACPDFTEGLEKQAYDDDGEPDKTSGWDHCLDAGGYFICFTYPVRSAAARRIIMAGV